MARNERLTDLIDAAGRVVCFHKIIEHYQRALEEPVDTPDEIQTILFELDAYKKIINMHRAEYERLRKPFAPNNKLVEALDDLVREYGVDHETA